MDNRPAFAAIDHVVLRLLEAEPLWSLLAGTLGLPVSWPLTRAPFATFGWINVGNTQLELWAAARNDDLPADATLPLAHGLALAPLEQGLAHSTALLAARGLPCKTSPAWRTADAQGVQQTNFTNATVTDLSDAGCLNFFCEWGLQAPIVPWPLGVPAAARRLATRDALEAADGGVLGLIGLDAVSMTAPDPAAARLRWQALSGWPDRVTPEVRLDMAEALQQRIATLGFAVRDLAQARDALAARQLLAADESKPSELVLASPALGHMRFCFHERTATHAV